MLTSPSIKRNQVWLELFLLKVAFWKALPILLECQRQYEVIVRLEALLAREMSANHPKSPETLEIETAIPQSGSLTRIAPFFPQPLP